MAELAALLVLVVSGARAFLTACLGLSMVFIGYHAVQVGLHITTPCPCLGGFLSRWKPLAQSESLLSFLFACGLGVASFIGLFPVTKSASPDAPCHAVLPSIALSAGLWLLLGGGVVWLWHGRTLGGDEGMEAAKSLQLLLHPGDWCRVWNDQPPLLSLIGTLAFKVSAPGLLSARIAVVLLEVSLAITLAVYYSQLGVRWAAPVSVILLWLAAPSSWASFMQEAPSYALAVTALLPMLVGGPGRLALSLSALLAAVALSVKLTAAFGLVVPFVWLLQRSARKAFVWGVAAVALTTVSALIQPGWSWTTMAATHLHSTVKDYLQYRIQPDVYAYDWLVCVLALFALANRYVTNRLASLIPWMGCALAALTIHFFHHPYFGYYSLHLITPLAVLGAIGIIDVFSLVKTGSISCAERWLATATIALVCVLWGWQRTSEIITSYRQSILIANTPIVEHLKALAQSGHTAYSSNPLWTFAAGLVQTPPELTVVSLKRGWSGQMNDAIATAMLTSNRVAGIVVSQTTMRRPGWSNLLSGYSATAQFGEDVLFVRKELNPKPIELGDQRRLLQRLGSVTQQLW
ncbi:MAG: hypothetical protein ACYDH9_09500 [Limisphaerales bacterium]